MRLKKNLISLDATFVLRRCLSPNGDRHLSEFFGLSEIAVKSGRNKSLLDICGMRCNAL